MDKPGTYLSMSCPCAFCEAARKLGYKAWDYVEYEKVGCDQFGMKYPQEKEIPMSNGILVCECGTAYMGPFCPNANCLICKKEHLMNPMSEKNWLVFKAEERVRELRKNADACRQTEEDAKKSRMKWEGELASVESALACLRANGFAEASKLEESSKALAWLNESSGAAGPPIRTVSADRSAVKEKGYFDVEFKCGCLISYSAGTYQASVKQCKMENGCFYDSDAARIPYDLAMGKSVAGRPNVNNPNIAKSGWKSDQDKWEESK